jgi:hypothetical protein
MGMDPGPSRSAIELSAVLRFHFNSHECRKQWRLVMRIT